MGWSRESERLTSIRRCYESLLLYQRPVFCSRAESIPGAGIVGSGRSAVVRLAATRPALERPFVDERSEGVPGRAGGVSVGVRFSTTFSGIASNRRGRRDCPPRLERPRSGDRRGRRSRTYLPHQATDGVSPVTSNRNVKRGS